MLLQGNFRTRKDRTVLFHWPQSAGSSLRQFTGANSATPRRPSEQRHFLPKNSRLKTVNKQTRHKINNICFEVCCAFLTLFCFAWIWLAIGVWRWDVIVCKSLQKVEFWIVENKIGGFFKWNVVKRFELLSCLLFVFCRRWSQAPLAKNVRNNEVLTSGRSHNKSKKMEPPLTTKVLRAPSLKRGQDNVKIQDRVRNKTSN